MKITDTSITYYIWITSNQSCERYFSYQGYKSTCFRNFLLAVKIAYTRYVFANNGANTRENPIINKKTLA